MKLIESRSVVAISYPVWLLVCSLKLVYERKANYVPTEHETIFRSHARLVTLAETYFPQCIFGRLVLNLLKGS